MTPHLKAPAKTPDHHRLYVIGDIHGRVDLLDRLLAMIEADALKHAKKKLKLIFLGDYIDRGIDSRGVIERLMRDFAGKLEPIFIRGNHDEMFMQFMKGDLSISQSWLSLGGAAALASYGINSLSGIGKGKLETLHRDVSAKVPPAHIEFLENTVLSVTYGDYYFVHAGVRPGTPFEKQRPVDQMGIRGDFLFSDFDFGKIIVHGHTIQAEPEVKKNRIGIDTGAFATGRLTCLILDGADRKFIET